MDSKLGDKLAEEQITKSLEEQLFKLVNPAREEEVGPLAPPIRGKTSRATPATIHRSAGWRYVVFGSLLTASIGVAAWRWSPAVDKAMVTPSDPAPLTQAAPHAAAPTAVALSSELARQLQPLARDFAALRQTVEQLEVRQEQLVRDNENLVSQSKASREEMARNNTTIDQIKATQIQMARDSQTLTERLNASQEQLARVIANASEPNVMHEEPKMSPEEPKATSKIPLPRTRQSANVAQTQKPAPTPALPQVKKPQTSSAWPWSMR
ncbi:hypothetical protein GA0061098_1014122 [Bradyrhizobium shewense]|uniref:Uncharacterized protein n=1 Tax=Bradyrhizobium shewense TaxID=1761772 RepID=A0A1C3XD90_9BRAD|nr:hypothetical protein [Bradyrhizobium shewense]SCB50267.1 hypothetical protein GA0061098_1014122 [Bradyrhizobium shewense]